jgi:hypothetical protein
MILGASVANFFAAMAIGVKYLHIHVDVEGKMAMRLTT